MVKHHNLIIHKNDNDISCYYLLFMVIVVDVSVVHSC